MSLANDPLNYAPLGGAPAGVPAGTPAQDTAPGVRPPGERDQDESRSDLVHALSQEPVRALTDDEREAAQADPGVPPRVYAPAAERVPKPPAPGHEDLAGRVDPTTPERQAAVDAQTGTNDQPLPPD